ncbi:MAG: hypothetical protein EA355_15740 [Rhodobacteraceae bacterium]|nr:MAG: hypothetical protein EA355_15740 [Paracoccaceae bacterium]
MSDVAELPDDPADACRAILDVVNALSDSGDLDDAKDLAAITWAARGDPMSPDDAAVQAALRRLAFRCGDAAERIGDALKRVAALARHAIPEVRASDAALAARRATIEATGRPPYEPCAGEIDAAERVLAALGHPPRPRGELAAILKDAAARTEAGGA